MSDLGFKIGDKVQFNLDDSDSVYLIQQYVARNDDISIDGVFTVHDIEESFGFNFLEEGHRYIIRVEEFTYGFFESRYIPAALGQMTLPFKGVF